MLVAGFILAGLLTASVPVSAIATDLYPVDAQTCSLVNVPTCELANLQLETSKLEPPNPETVDLRQAAYYYNRYHDLAPDDLLGLKRLAETCTALESAGMRDENCREAADRLLRITQYALRDSGSDAASPTDPSSAAVLRDFLAARTDDRRIVAELLDVSVEDVELGPNLVENGGLEEWVGGNPESWVWVDMTAKNYWNEGMFAGYTESLGVWDSQTARVDGFWVHHKDNLKEARSGFWYRNQGEGSQYGISLRADGLYFLSFSYCTERLPDYAAALWVSSDPDVLFTPAYRLHQTSSGWRRMVVIGWNDSEEPEFIRPLVLNFRAGTVWFDVVSVREIKSSSGALFVDRETFMWVLDGLNDSLCNRVD